VAKPRGVHIDLFPENEIQKKKNKKEVRLPDVKLTEIRAE
jgi:hypothetical protein